MDGEGAKEEGTIETDLAGQSRLFGGNPRRMLSNEEFITTFFRPTEIPVAPSMERAFGYFGVGRWVAFHWSKKLKSLCWADSRSNSCRSASTVWHRFLVHPFVAPYLQLRRPDGNGIGTLDFEAKDDDPDFFLTLPSEGIDVSALDLDSARFIEESRKLAYAIVLDRAKRTLYITRWSHAFFFLTFYKDESPFEILGGNEEEEGEEIDEPEIAQTSDWDDEPLPVDPATEKRFLAWLDRRWNNPGDLYQLALQHCRYRQYSKALEALRRGLEIRPECAVINWMTSQVHGALKRWPEALETCKKAIQLQTTTEKEIPVEVLFMWQGDCFSKLSRYSEAIESYKLVTDLKPNHADAYHELGWCHTELGHYPEAAAAHEQEIKLRISNNSGADEKAQIKLRRAYEELGMAYLSDLRLPEAERVFRQAINISPDSLQAHAGLVSVYMEMGNDSEAEKEQRLVSELEAMPASTSELPSTH